MSFQVKEILLPHEASAIAAEALDKIQMLHLGVVDVILVMQDGAVYSAKGDVGRIEQEASEAAAAMPVELRDSTQYELNGDPEEWSGFLSLVAITGRGMAEGRIQPVYGTEGDAAVCLSLTDLLQNPAIVEASTTGEDIVLTDLEGPRLVQFICGFMAQAEILGMIPRHYSDHPGMVFVNRFMDQVPEELRQAYVDPVTEALDA